MKIKKILVPMDGSKNSFRGLDYAIELAKLCDASITSVNVIAMSYNEPSQVKIPYGKELLNKAEIFFNRAKKHANQKGVIFTNKIIFGNAGEEITNFAQSKKRKRFDLIVIGARGLGSIKEFFLGSTSNYVIHKSKIPVLVVK